MNIAQERRLPLAAPANMRKFLHAEIRCLARNTGARQPEVRRAYFEKLKPLMSSELVVFFNPTREQLNDQNFHFDFAPLGIFSKIRDELLPALRAQTHIEEIKGEKRFETVVDDCYGAVVVVWFEQDAPAKQYFRELVLGALFEILKQEYVSVNGRPMAQGFEKRCVLNACKFAALRVGSEKYFGLEADRWKEKIEAETGEIESGGLGRKAVLDIFYEFAIREHMAMMPKKGELEAVISKAAIRTGEHIRRCMQSGLDASRIGSIPHQLAERGSRY